MSNELVAIDELVKNADKYSREVLAWSLSLRSENTRSSYRQKVVAFAGWLDTLQIDLLAVSDVHVDGYRVYLETVRFMKPASVGLALSSLDSFFGYAVKRSDVLVVNPVVGVVRPKVDADYSSTSALSSDEVQRLLKVAKDEKNPLAFAFVSFVLGTGVRVTEALDAKFSDLRSTSGTRVVNVSRKGGKRQAIPLSAPVVDSLALYIGSDAAEGKALVQAVRSDSVEDDRFLFRTKTGSRMGRTQVQRILTRLAKKAQIESLSCHTLRHTHATLAIKANVPLLNLQLSLGHSDPRTTERYIHNLNTITMSSTHAVAGFLEVE